MSVKTDFYRDFLTKTANTVLRLAEELEKLPHSDRKSRLSIQRKISDEYLRLTETLPEFYERAAKDFITPLERCDMYAMLKLLASSVRACDMLSKSICCLKPVNMSFLSGLLGQTVRYAKLICDIQNDTDFFKKCTSISELSKRLTALKNGTDNEYINRITSENGSSERLLIIEKAKNCCTQLEETADKAIEIAIKNV